ncbi:DUF5007 domain-containing protein [Flavitalea flava]
MQKIYKYIGLALITGVVLGACKKAPNGYMSQQIRYPDNPMQIQRGVIKQTLPVEADGSSAPIQYELLDIRDAATHKHADSVYKNQERYIFTGLFDASVDTTVALLNTIRQKISAPCFDFNVHTGAFTFYGTTANVPLGTYEYDIKATNESGSYVYKNIATFSFFDGLPYEIDAGGCAWFQDGTSTSGDLGAPQVTIQQLSTSGDRVILEIIDKNNMPFNPQNNEFIPRGNRSSFLTFAKFNPLIVSDTALTCDFEVTPFPFAPAAQGFTIYYRIPSKFALVDPGYTPTPDRIYSVNPRFTFRVYQDGTYLVKVKMNNVTRSPI